MIVKTEAVVLRSMKYRETSRIVTFYTRKYGKIGGIVKGARAPKNNFGAALQLMSYVSLVVYKKEGRDLHPVTQCDLMESFRLLAEDLDRMSVGMAMIELVSNIAHDEEENIPLFDLLVASLTAANNVLRNPTEILLHFEIRLAGILGFKPVFCECISCGKQVPDTEAEIRFELERGGPLCSKCQVHQGQTVPLSGRQLRYLGALSVSKESNAIDSMNIDDKAKHDIAHLLESFLKKHVTGIRPSKSDRIFSQIMIDS